MGRADGEGIAEEGELFRTHIGGSALTEGVMMRGKLSWAVAARRPDGGIYLEEHEFARGAAQARWRRLPIVRGCVAFVESMLLSMRAMGIAGDHAYDGEGWSFAARVSEGLASWDDRAHEPEAGASAPLPGAGASHAAAPCAPAPAAPGKGPETAGSAMGDGAVGSEATFSATPSGPAPSDPAPRVDEPPREGMPPAAMAGSMALGLVLGVVIFMAIPVAVTNLLVGDYTAANAVTWNLVEAALRVAIFVGYIWALGRVPEMARVFGYHGAEHLSIHCFEHGLPLTPQNAARFSRLHVRCGTAFLIMTMLVAIVVNTVVPVAALADSLSLAGVARAAFVLASRIVLLPLVAGVSYEVTVKWAGSHPENPLVRVVLWPGLQMQRLTTRVPDEGMLECAIAALACVRRREEEAGLSAGEDSR